MPLTNLPPNLISLNLYCKSYDFEMDQLPNKLIKLNINKAYILKYLPLSLKYLKINKLSMYLNLSYLINLNTLIIGNFNEYIIGLPPNLKELRLSENFNHSINFDNLCELEILTFGEKFNHPLNISHLNKLSLLQLGIYYNCALEDIPINIKTLIINKFYNFNNVNYKLVNTIHNCHTYNYYTSIHL